MSTSTRLSRRNRAVLSLLSQGFTDEAIAGRLRIELGALHGILDQIYRHINVSDRGMASSWWRRRYAVDSADASESPERRPLFGLREDGDLGEAAVAHGLMPVLGIMSSFLGFGPRLFESMPHFPDSAMGRSHIWLFEQFLSGNFEEAVEQCMRVPYSRRLSQDDLIAGLMRMLSGKPINIEFPAPAGFVPERRLACLAERWLVARDDAAGRELDVFLLGLPRRQPVRHLALILVFHQARLRQPARSAWAAGLLLGDAAATLNYLVRNKLLPAGTWAGGGEFEPVPHARNGLMECAGHLPDGVDCDDTDEIDCAA